MNTRAEAQHYLYRVRVIVASAAIWSARASDVQPQSPVAPTLVPLFRPIQSRQLLLANAADRRDQSPQKTDSETTAARERWIPSGSVMTISSSLSMQGIASRPWRSAPPSDLGAFTGATSHHHQHHSQATGEPPAAVRLISSVCLHLVSLLSLHHDRQLQAATARDVVAIDHWTFGPGFAPTGVRSEAGTITGRRSHAASSEGLCFRRHRRGTQRSAGRASRRREGFRSTASKSSPGRRRLYRYHTRNVAHSVRRTPASAG